MNYQAVAANSNLNDDSFPTSDQPLMLPRSRGYCFTYFCNNDYSLPTLLDPLLKFYAAQFEMCPDTERLHVQGTIEFTSLKSFAQAKAFLPEDAHIEVRLGSPAQAVAYSSKDDTRVVNTTPTLLGDLPKGRGSRTDLADLQVALDKGTPTADIASDFFSTFLRYNRGIAMYQSLRVKPRY